ncbi:MAG: ribosomal protein L13e [Nitrososphaerota archaeon]|jgi:large subunit ribosomal protein L13e|uniref:ribosomal protein L13e n=1 Tax=Candidatus Bathycorpusculum sp. TaxID=2994959 RepID=UPI00282661A7|nr:ribosomal protein L13e [Candidatus Termitimicrobium sp.]MCL2431636.1 ribosomal protein L13e [Candidatus Termitimicrobium sp.]MDR0493293.1 ribosomal protein L13e [Nitrososphaerota archaeon]
MHHIKPSFIKPNGKQKQGRGFSINELKAAGVSKQQAKKAGLPVDVRRKSQHDQNIQAIKAHTKKP